MAVSAICSDAAADPLGSASGTPLAPWSGLSSLLSMRVAPPLVRRTTPYSPYTRGHRRAFDITSELVLPIAHSGLAYPWCSSASLLMCRMLVLGGLVKHPKALRAATEQLIDVRRGHVQHLGDLPDR